MTLHVFKMAKRQHGRSLRDRTVESEKMAKQFDLGLNSSDDEAPEEVTFEDSKASAIKSMKDALETARREKELLKEKRRRRQELFQEQKKKKLLPADVLEEIDKPQPKKQKLSIDQAEDKRNIETSGLEEEEETEAETSKNKKKTSKNKKKTSKNKVKTSKNKVKGVKSLKGNNCVVRLKSRPSATCQQQTALDWIQSRLYGEDSCRTTNNNHLSLEHKRGAKKSAALQFIRKDWATEKKEKAEKFKKQWLKQNVYQK